MVPKIKLKFDAMKPTEKIKSKMGSQIFNG